MNKLFALLIGVNLSLAIAFFVINQEHQKNDAQIAEKHIETKMAINEFNRDFELQLASMSDSEAEEHLHLSFAERHIKKNIDIEDDRKKAEEKRKLMEKKAADTFASMEEEAKLLDIDSNFEEELDLEDIDFKDF